MLFFQSAFHKSSVQNITAHKPVPIWVVGFRYVRQIGEISSVRQSVKVDDNIVRITLQPVSDEVGTDKSSTTRDQ
jgi:hypothetical protein